jgi:hypothetical protein
MPRLFIMDMTTRVGLKSKQKELLKSLGLGREKPISPQAILIENEIQLKES